VRTQLDRDLVQHLHKLAKAEEGMRRDFVYDSIAKLLLDQGTSFSHRPFLPRQEKVLLHAFSLLGFAPETKHCFYNAQKLALLSDDLKYVEGYVVPYFSGLPVVHAWAAIGNKPVDITLRSDPDDATTEDPERLLERAADNLGNSYFGMLIPKDVYFEIWVETRQIRSVIADWESGFEVLRRGIWW
jgi:hypothetical protein